MNRGIVQTNDNFGWEFWQSATIVALSWWGEMWLVIDQLACMYDKCRTTHLIYTFTYINMSPFQSISPECLNWLTIPATEKITSPLC